MDKVTRIGFALVITGLVVPQIIDAVEVAYSLDIKRELGVLPWLIMTVAGLVVLLKSLVNRLRK